MDRVKVVICGPREKTTAGSKTAIGLDLRLEHPETGESLDCRDVVMKFPMEGFALVTAEFIVSEVVIEPAPDVQEV